MTRRTCTPIPMGMEWPLDDISTLTGNQFGVHDVACPACGPDRRSPANRVRKVLRIWRKDDGFASFKCARCGIQGYAREWMAKPTFRARLVKPYQDRDNAERTAGAIALFSEARPIAGTPAETYLERRGVPYDCAALRWHPSCPAGKGRRMGCMVALVRNIITNRPQALHRTVIDAQGRKVERLSLGPIAGGAIKLTDDAGVTTTIAVGEGIETTLSLCHLDGMASMPVWSLISKGGIATFPALPGIESVLICVDDDDAGRDAAAEAGVRLSAAGIEVLHVTPTIPGADINDLIAEVRHEAS